MIVHVDSSSTVTVSDGENLRALSVNTVVADGNFIGGALAAVGLGYEGDETHIWLDIAELRKRGRPATPSGSWDHEWNGMVAFAADNGWLSEDGRFMRAHIYLEPAT